jgi:hypothetical protein
VTIPEIILVEEFSSEITPKEPNSEWEQRDKVLDLKMVV